MTGTFMFPVEGGEEGEFTVEFTASYDTGTPRSYASGGSPDGWDIENVEVTDWEGTNVTSRYRTDPAFEKAVDEAIQRTMENDL